MPPETPSGNVTLQIVETGQDAGKLDCVTRQWREEGPVEFQARALDKRVSLVKTAHVRLDIGGFLFS